MSQSETTARANAIKTAGELARGSIETVIKDAVAEAMRDVESERGTSTSNRTKVPAALLLLAVGALIGYAVAKRGGEEPFSSDELGPTTETEPGGMTSAGQGTTSETGMSTSGEDDETVDTVTDS